MKMNQRNNSIAIVGMGKTGISVASFYKEYGLRCEAFDERQATLPEGMDIPLHIGPLNADELAQFKRIVVSPGVPWQHPELLALRQRGADVIGDLDVFVEHSQASLIAVTGTNGKTTTTEMIGLLLETLPGGCLTGGNIGRPMLDLLNEKTPPQRMALELSSFQLERSHGLRAATSIFLNIQADHVDAHLSDEEYLNAKLKLFEHQQAGSTAYLPAESRWDNLAEKLLSRDIRVHRFGFVKQGSVEEESVSAGVYRGPDGCGLFWHHEGHRVDISCSNIPARGSHQHLNVAIAAQVASDEGVHLDVICEAITSFRGLPHRLRNLGKVRGYEWFDDSKATNPAAAIAALDSFDRVLWICGGLRKGIDLAVLKHAVSQHVEKAFVIGSDPQSFAALLESANVPYEVVGTMQAAVTAASKHGSKIPVLLSPAAASMDQFENYAHRGRVFLQSIQALKGASA